MSVSIFNYSKRMNSIFKVLEKMVSLSPKRQTPSEEAGTDYNIFREAKAVQY